MKIYEASQADSGVLAELVFQLLSELSGNSPSNHTISCLTQTAMILLQDEAIIALLAEQEGKAIGVVVLNPCASMYARYFGEITEFYVRPEHRSQGVGSALMNKAIAIANARAWSRLEVGTPELPAWSRTAAFYQQNGFIEVGLRMKLPFVIQ